MPSLSPFRVHLARVALLNLAQALVFTTWMVFQIEVIGLTPLQLVLVGTAMEVTIFLFEIPTGVLADVYSRRLSVIIGTVLMGLAYLLMGGFPTFAAAIASQILWGLGYTFTSGAYDAWMVDEIGQERAGEGFLRGAQVGRIAGLIGIVASTLLAAVNLALPILIGGVLHLVSAVLLVAFMPERGFAPTPREERSTWGKWFGTFRDGLRVVRGRPILWSILGIGFFFGFFSEAWDRLWQAHLIDGISVPTLFPSVVWIGILAGVDAILGAVLVEVARRRIDTNNPRQLTRALLALTLVMIAAQIGFALSGGFALAVVLLFAFTLARGTIEPLFGVWANQHIDSNVRATVLSMQSQTDAIGQISGGPPLGLIGQRSIPLALIASALTLSPAAALLARVGRREAQREQV
jgi:DHA3 family tetracycline resistance protein-like MFS transporter